MGKIAAMLRLTRIEHSAMLAIAVIAAELLAGVLPNIAVLILSLAAPVFVSMGSFAINDYFDIKVDKLNGKKRPLVTMELKPADAVYISAASFIIGICASALINAYALEITVVFALLAILYSYKLKEVFLLGNAYIALTMVIPFVFGAYVVSTYVPVGILLICLMVFFSGFAREIHGTIRDFAGDIKIRGAKTVPRVAGVRTAGFIALALYIIAVLISAYLFLAVQPFMLNIIFGLLVGISDVMLLYVGIGYAFRKKRLAGFYYSSRNISLFAMGIALLAIMLSALVQI